jgi:hypothetical protein
MNAAATAAAAAVVFAKPVMLVGVEPAGQKYPVGHAADTHRHTRTHTNARSRHELIDCMAAEQEQVRLEAVPTPQFSPAGHAAHNANANAADTIESNNHSN